jgi:hypothetical protein
MGGTVMEIKINLHAEKKPDRSKYPFLIVDRKDRLCLVGRYSVIVLEDGGDSYSRSNLATDEAYVRDLIAGWDVPTGVEVILKQ